MYDKRSKLKELHSFTKREIWKGFLLFLSQIKGNTVNNIKTKQEGKRYKRWISFMPLAFWEFTTWLCGKELMTQDEIAVMDGGKCILQLRGVRPFLSDKYDITKHPNYKYLSDFDKRNAFDVERYMSTRPAIVKPDEAFDIYEIDLSDEDAAAEE